MPINSVQRTFFASDLTAFQKPNPDAMNDTDPKPDPPADYTPPKFHWDWWEEDAIARGLDRDLATLGRAVIRETDQHRWSVVAARLADEGIVEELLTRSPELAKRLYEVLLETDGLRYAWVEESKSSELIELPGCYL